MNIDPGSAGAGDEVASLVEEWLALLNTVGLMRDVRHLLDALWLSAAMPEPAQLGESSELPHAPVAGRAAAAPAAPRPVVHTPSALTGKSSRRNQVDVVVGKGDPVKPEKELYAHSNMTQVGDTLRARPIRVAGATALREASAMARALRPLGRRRRSHTRFVFDEDASVERYADSGVLVPQWTPDRERFFSATLLVEETPALPLWRGLARELETLLTRQGGFRRFERRTLVEVGGALRLRSRGGATYAPRTLLEDDAALVLLATDGTTSAWSDGRMAKLLRELGSRSPIVVLQWLSERFWPNTALGSAPLLAVRPRAGAANSELQVSGPRWIRMNQPFVAVPLAPLTPAGFARLAGSLMGKPGVRMPSALLWCDPKTPALNGDAVEPLDPGARITRFRSVASARVLKAAVQLSAAAPLTLPVIRLVHHVMQPDAPTGDLPMLLLGGLLERQDLADGAPTLDGNNGDDDVLFDFAPGVREALQASLLKGDADDVKAAVWRYIAERSGSAVDFTALLLDPEGHLSLPAWARPFAEVTRHVESLFAPRPDEPYEVIRESAWAPGMTVQAEHALASPAKQLSWSPDGSRLAVCTVNGVRVLRPVAARGGPRSFESLPVALIAVPTVLVIKGGGVAEAPMETLLMSLRARLNGLFRGAWNFLHHAVDPVFFGTRGRSPARDVQRLLELATKRRALMIFVGDEEFGRSSWMKELETAVDRMIDAAEHPAVIFCTAREPVEDAAGPHDWRVLSLGNSIELDLRHGTAEVGFALADALERGGSRALPEVAFGEDAVAICWNHENDLLVADAGRKRVVRERDLHQYQRIPPELPPGEPMAIAANPIVRALLMMGGEQIIKVGPGKGSASQRLDIASGTVGLAWSSDGKVIAGRHGGKLGQGAAVDDGWGADGFAWLEEEADSPVTAGPAWRPGRRDCVFGLQSGEVRQWDVNGRDWNDGKWLQSHDAPVAALAWSTKGDLLVAVWADGTLSAGRPDGQAWTAKIPLQMPPPLDTDASICIGFMPGDAVHAFGFETLAVSWGAELRLLRLQASMLVLAPTLLVSEAVSPVNVTVLAANELLHAIAIEFLQSELLSGMTADDRDTRLGESIHDADIAHLLQSAGNLFKNEVAALLGGAPDPLRKHTTGEGEQLLAQLTEGIEALSISLRRGSVPEGDTQMAERLEAASASVRVCHRLIAGLSDTELRDIELGAGAPLATILSNATLERNGLGGKTDHEEHIRFARALDTAGEAIWAVKDRLSPIVARAAWLRAQDGATRFLECRSMCDYVDRFLTLLGGAWKSDRDSFTVARPLYAPSGPPSSALDPVALLGETCGLSLEPHYGVSGETRWLLKQNEVAPWMRLLGAIVITTLARLTGAPMPKNWMAPGLRVLWVDDRPRNNEREIQDLNARGFMFVHAPDTESALSILSSGASFHAVISDMSRPNDPRGGFSLLEAMRSLGHQQPFLIYSASNRNSTEAARLGAVVATNRFDELEEALRRALLEPL